MRQNVLKNKKTATNPKIHGGKSGLELDARLELATS